jgi:two-component system OmpR family sensor kinase
MSAMVNDLLDLARLDEVREPVRELVDIGRLTADACDDARARSPKRAISLEAPDTLEVVGDADQLRRLIDNLLANATVHTPSETAIDVVLSAEGGEAVLTVRDHGPGLDETEQVFERFWRQSESRGRDSGGAGLGLAIVAGVVEAHGGSVRAENHPDGGALFTVRLPAGVTAAAG